MHAYPMRSQRRSCTCKSDVRRSLSGAVAMQALRPTLFIGVPRVFDKLYDGVYAKLALARPLQRLLFHLAFWYKSRQIRAGYKWDQVPFCAMRFLSALINSLAAASLFTLQSHVRHERAKHIPARGPWRMDLISLLLVRLPA